MKKFWNNRKEDGKVLAELGVAVVSWLGTFIIYSIAKILHFFKVV